MMRTLGGYIRNYLDRTGLSQTELSARSNVPRVTINRLVKEKTALPDADTRRKLAKAMGASHVDILVAAGELEPEEVEAAGVQGVAEERPLPAEVRELLQNVTWTRDTTDGMKAVLRMMRGMQLAAEAPAGMPDAYDDLDFEGRVPKEALKGTERT